MATPYDALSGPKPQAPQGLPVPSNKFTTYTLGMVWDALTPAIVARVIRDCLQLSRYCYSYRSTLQVASSSDALDKYLKFISVKRTPQIQAASYWRIYVDKEIAELPHDSRAELTDIIQVHEKPGSPQYLRKDTVFPAEVRYPVYKIAETVPLYRSPPSGPADMNQQEWMF